jgi:hypothetical protein
LHSILCSGCLGKERKRKKKGQEMQKKNKANLREELVFGIKDLSWPIGVYGKRDDCIQFWMSGACLCIFSIMSCSSY